MKESNREFIVDYHDQSLRNDLTDVTFEISESAENALFAALHREMETTIRDGGFPSQQVHLWYRLSNQHSEHPPWVEIDNPTRVYDLELSTWDYHILTKIIGKSLSNVLGPNGADKYTELVEIWIDITEQMHGVDET